MGLIDKELFCKSILIRLMDDRDRHLGISGPEGEGKSVMAWDLAQTVDSDFDVEEQTIFSINEVKGKLRRLKKYKALILDEGLEIFYKRNWNSKEQKKAIKTISTIRQRNLFLIYCAPRFSDLDEQLRNWRIRLWVRMTSRGRGLVYSYDKRKLVGDPWYLESHKLRLKRTYKGVIQCNPMPKPVDKIYRRIKDEAFEKAQEDGENSLSLNEQKVGAVDRLLSESGWSTTKCFDIIGIPKSTYYSIKKNAVS